MAFTALVVGALTGLMATAVMGFDSDSGYCSLCPDHTMCQYKEQAPRCRGFYTRDLSWVERKSAVHAHNVLRNRLAAGDEVRGRYGQAQPSAANMRKLVWDEELATMARRWASQCVFAQDTCRTSADGTPVAQNIYMQMVAPGFQQPSNVSVASAVATWYSEVNEFDGRLAGQPYAYNAPAWHYTLLAWARTTQVGCGFADYLEQSRGQSSVSARLIVCNYKEAGNELGAPVYAPGTPLSQCEWGALVLPQPPPVPAYFGVVQPAVTVGTVPPWEPDPAWDPEAWVSTLDEQDAGRAAAGAARGPGPGVIRGAAGPVGAGPAGTAPAGPGPVGSGPAGRSGSSMKVRPSGAGGLARSVDDDVELDGLLYPALCSGTSDRN